MIAKINIERKYCHPERSEGSKGVLRFFASLRMTTGQSTIEFTFAMIVIMFLIYGMVRVFRWTGMDLAQRRWAQDNSITTLVGSDPSSELNSDIDMPQPMAAVYRGSITNGQ
jgi:hypothetical protein